MSIRSGMTKKGASFSARDVDTHTLPTSIAPSQDLWTCQTRLTGQAGIDDLVTQAQVHLAAASAAGAPHAAAFLFCHHELPGGGRPDNLRGCELPLDFPPVIGSSMAPARFPRMLDGMWSPGAFFAASDDGDASTTTAAASSASSPASSSSSSSKQAAQWTMTMCGIPLVDPSVGVFHLDSSTSKRRAERNPRCVRCVWCAVCGICCMVCAV